MSIMQQTKNKLYFKLNMEGDSSIPQLNDVEIAELFKYAQEKNLVGDLTLADFYDNPDLAVQVKSTKSQIELDQSRTKLDVNYQIQDLRDAVDDFESKVRKLIDKD